jgi:hypothetical protein
VSQSSWWVKPKGRNPCNSLIMNNLQYKQPLSGQTTINLVKHGQNQPILLGLSVALCQLQPSAFSLQPFLVSGPKIWACSGRGNGYSSSSRANGLRGGFCFSTR